MIIRQIALGDIAGKTGKDRCDRAGCSGVIAATPIDTEPAFDAISSLMTMAKVNALFHMVCKWYC
jgi:hypothetical protein